MHQPRRPTPPGLNEAGYKTSTVSSELGEAACPQHASSPLRTTHSSVLSAAFPRMLEIQMPDPGVAIRPKTDLGGSPLPLGQGIRPATSTRPNRNNKTFFEPESAGTPGGLSGSSLRAFFALFRLNRGRWQLRLEASARRAPVQAGRGQRPVSGPVPVEAWKGLRRERPSQE